MSTIDYQLNILRDTQMVQRRLLEKHFPYIDWARMPFSSYGDFFRLRGILDDCGAVWTNAYGRSNGEAESTRKYLKDYSGNGRDIELFNFGWTDGSGYKDGALVGDGVDDYGQCMKDFALPDGYTVVAMREIMNDYGCVASRMNVQTQGAFIFENQNNNVFSYGAMTVVGYPKLFSYQTKNSYNGTDINAGTSSDDETFKLKIFHQSAMNNYLQAALYSFGIFTRTLTDDELRIVENCMYAEWIAMTGKLEDIEYYDILDARFRSNEESEDKRNRWVGRLGKLHMTLNNFGFSRMSGWNGYRGDFSTWTPVNSDNAKLNDYKLQVNVSNTSNTFLSNSQPNNIMNVKVKVTGLDNNRSLGYVDKIYFFSYDDGSGGDFSNRFNVIEDGIYEISVTGTSSWNIFVTNTKNGRVVLENPIIIEALPDYGGALVSDGVDDYAISDETIDSDIKGAVVMAEKIGEPTKNGFVFLYGNPFGDDTSRTNGIGLLWNYAAKYWYIGFPTKNMTDAKDNLYTLSRDIVGVTGVKLYINYRYEPLHCALYQLRLIKTQPTDAQLEAIKWQCRKEHDDYLIHMGWKEVE